MSQQREATADEKDPDDMIVSLVDFATSTDNYSLLLTLLSISPTSQQPLSTVDLNALHQIKYTLTDINTKGTLFFSTWNFTSTSNPCHSFSGVTCSVVNHHLRVTSLFLGTGLSDSLGLAGTISPTGLYQLTELTQLVLYPGLVTGFIPSQIGRLKNLRVISLTNNHLTGTIPTSLSDLKNLHTLDLSHNKLAGVIPPTLTSALPKLKILILSHNNLAGKIPEFSGESRLVHVDLKNNKLSGTLPGNTPETVRYLSLSSNRLWGPIVKRLTSPYLVYLDLSMNKFSGPLPGSLFRPGLSLMYLQRNYFFGRVPPLRLDYRYGSYGPGSTIDLSHNFLSGEVPEFLAGVETLFLNNNRFVGEVPKSYVGNVFAGVMRTLYLQHNYLVSFPMDKSGMTVLPDGVALCLSCNCMVPPAVGLTACPAKAGGPVSRPGRQCSVFNDGNSLG
ncbi:uncharacterized protein LOC143613422 [Bidens hawaiensis]|uniref:uncharacterized protein LOC143613422 n=1 Tax=Bidens hawaiensis TaxID=980011 RepID=UPI0040498404